MNSTEAGGHAPVPAAARDRRRRNSVASIDSNIKTDSLIAVRGTCHGCDACRPRWPASNRLVESLDPLPLRPRLPIKAQPPPRAAVLAMQQGDWEALRPPLHAYRRRWTFGAGSSTEGMGLNLTLGPHWYRTTPLRWARNRRRRRREPPRQSSDPSWRSAAARPSPQEEAPCVPPPCAVKHPRGNPAVESWANRRRPRHAHVHAGASLHNPARGLLPQPPYCSHAGTYWF